jgi:hypothetical protein
LDGFHCVHLDLMMPDHQGMQGPADFQVRVQ